MKKILCITLSLLLMFNTTAVYADEHGGSSGSFDVTPTPAYPIPDDMLDENGRLKPPSMLTFLDKVITAGRAGEDSSELSGLLYSFLGDYDNSDNSISIENGGSTVHFHDTFADKFNNALQDYVHTLDGYYLIEPSNYYSPTRIRLETGYTGELLELMNKTLNSVSTYVYYKGQNADSNKNTIYHIDFSKYYYIDTTYKNVYCFDKELNKWKAPIVQSFYNYSYTPQWQTKDNLSTNFFYNYKIDMNKIIQYSYGAPFKIFYSQQDVMNYILKGEQRTYAPKLPSGGFKINLKYITNTVNLPNITYNITTENKTELEIQNQYDTTINNYLDSLDDFSSGEDDKPVTPTPTPIISDGQPTPTPGFTDGSLTPTPPPTNVDLTDTNNWLEKIYNWLEDFGKSHDKFTKDLSDYLETHKGKLEEIIKALDKIADGMEKGEDDGCKYDYSELSDFMKELWNESDKKFDTMIDLLETNNEYQKKLVKSLNDIKAILVTQTVLELFQNRSEETANQAKEKFPTSLPWDIAMVLNAMSAEPKALKVELPIKIESFKINESITVDLTGKEWEQLATTCRYLLSITFILYLIHLSRKLFFKGDDD